MAAHTNTSVQATNCSDLEVGTRCTVRRLFAPRVDPYCGGQPCVDAALNVAFEAVPNMHCL